MKKVFLKSSILFAMAALVLGCNRTDKLADDFVSPPESITTGVYWYWMSDNISKEGVVKDLHAMKQAGINAVFIGNIGGEGAPYGDVKLFTDEWWEVLHTAMKTAGELGIEVGMFNCPGWSHSGGPWIKAGQSMRHLVASETRVKGGGKIAVKLPVPQQPSQYKDWSDKFINNEGKPSPHFQDVRTLAVFVPDDYRRNLFDEAGAKVTATNMRPLKDVELNYPVVDVPEDSPLSIKYIVSKGQEASVTLRLPKPEDARSLSIYTPSYYRGEGELQAKDTNGLFVSVAVFPLYRVFPIPSIGYTPFAPTVVGFDKVTSDEYRIVFRGIERDAAIGKITLSPTVALDKYPEKTLARMSRVNPPYTEYKWTTVQNVPAGNDEATAIAPAKVIDVTDRMQPDGTLVWDAPEGNWLVMRMGMVPNEVFVSPASPEGTGWEIDKLNSEYLQHHFDNFLGEVLRRIPAEDRKTFRVTVMDSWEKGAQMFTDNFIDSIKARYGYDPAPFLPVLTGHVVGSPEQSERFLWDLRRLVAEMIGDNFLPDFNDILHKHGIETWIENYGDWGFPGEFLIYGKNSDRVGGEFWTEGDMRYIEVAASCAHIYNKPRVYAESFTSGSGFRAHPYSLKRDGDAAFAAGLTSCILHVYIEQPSNNDIHQGITAWFGVEFNRKNTWFGQIDLFTAYLKRCGLMLEQGLPVSDIAYFIGEDVPVNSGPFGLNPNTAKDSIDVPVLPQGYHADYVNSDVIINALSVKDGRIVLPHGISYSILVLPPFETMRPEVLKNIERLVNDGATVLGEAPERSPSLQNYPEADRELTALANKMWGDKTAKQRSYGKGKILSGMTIEEALKTINTAPDVKLDNENFVYNHRSTADREIYFIANRSEKTVQIAPEFRVAGKQPELWNPVNGERRLLPAFEQKDASTIIPLKFEPYESMFVVFSRKGKPKSFGLDANFPAPKILTEINTPWTVTFESDKIKRGPSEPVVFDKLQSWTQNEDERIRYYSGTAVYSNTFTLDIKPSEKVYIDLGRACNMAKVKINGQYAGGAWTYPYRVDITGVVKTGENKVEIEVVNNWVNRLIGDSLVPENERVTNYQFDSWMSKKLRDSGLLGPVKIESETL